MAPPTLASRVEAAFAAARQGDLGPSSAIAEAGPEALPLIAPFVSDPDEDARRLAVDLAATIGSPDAGPILIRGLGDAAADVRERAARGLFGADAVEPSAEARDALVAAIERGDRDAAVLLLLGEYPGDATVVTTLRGVRDGNEGGLSKLEDWGPAVPTSLPAAVALSRVGDGADRVALLERVETASSDEKVFLLDAIEEIDDPAVLHAVAGAALGDETEIAGGVPSGPGGPRRRVCDLAVDALVERLDLEVDFELNDAGRYSDEQANQVRSAIRGSIPR